MYTNDRCSKTSLFTFISRSFTKANLIQACGENGAKSVAPKDSIVNDCLRLYGATQLMRELEVAKILQWHDKLIILCLLSGQKTASQILSDELTETALAKQLPVAAFGVVHHGILSIEESKKYLHRRIRRLKKKGIILLSPRERAYRLNPLMRDYFAEIFGSISGEQIWEDAVSHASDVMGRDIREYLLPGKEMSQFLVKNIGEGTWSLEPFKAWVSKTDITQFLRCKYRVFVIHTRNLALDELRDPRLIRSLLQKGTGFEGSLISQMPFEEVADMESVIDKNVIFRSPKLIQNHELGIRGIVDLIQIGRGKLFPIEIKYHRDVTEIDRLELAFYWRLLQPLRRVTPRPKGYILLNTGEVAEVTLTGEDFARLDSLVNEIRSVKEVGTEPVLCSECNFCNLYRDECLPQAREKGTLTLIHGIAGTRQGELTSLGIKDIHELAGADTLILHQVWRQLTRYAPGLAEIRRMQIHARCLSEHKPIYFGSSGVPVGDKVLILDLEYDNFVCIWLLGLLASDGQTTRCYQIFADEMEEEREVLNRFNELLEKYPTHQILTWDGLRADIPQLDVAWRRQGFLPEKLEDLKRRHLDLYNFFLHNYRFPLGSFGLKEVGRYLGFKRKHEGMDGLEAQMLYHQYLNIPKRGEQERSRIKQLLLEYNREDLEAALFVLSQLRSLATNAVLTS